MPNPEYLHILVNHAPLFLLMAALVPLLLGLIFRSLASVNAGLLLVVIAALLTPVVMWSGEEAEERAEHGEIAVYVDDAGEAWIHDHEDRAKIAANVIYGTGALALLAMLLGSTWEGARWVFGGLSALAVLVSVGFLGWTAQAGGQIMHPEFRDAAAPFPASHTGGEHEHLDEHGHEPHDTPDDSSHAPDQAPTPDAAPADQP